ncbi:hypothetical protein L2E82_51272 [Cichorium intybus]|nr:hypothetical protein L2E82_51272 [Cichorium intybus]
MLMNIIQPETEVLMSDGETNRLERWAGDKGGQLTIGENIQIRTVDLRCSLSNSNFRFFQLLTSSHQRRKEPLENEFDRGSPDDLQRHPSPIDKTARCNGMKTKKSLSSENLQER